MEKFNIDKSYVILIVMILSGILLAIFFINIFNRLFAISTWQDIKEFIEVFLARFIACDNGKINCTISILYL